MTNEERQLPVDVETQVARWVRNYIGTDHRSDWVREAEVLRHLCSGLESQAMNYTLPMRRAG